MRIKKTLLASFFMLLLGGTSGFAQKDSVYIQVKLAETATETDLKVIDANIVTERIFPCSPKQEERHRKHGLHLWYKVQAADTIQARILMDKFSASPSVDKVNWEKQIETTVPDESAEVSVPALRSATDLPVNDPLYPKQWHLQNHLYPQGIDINVEKAWALEQGSRNVIVAVMDERIDMQHEDLRQNLWVNEAELNGKEGVDDDGNGYVDDVYGYTYVKGITPAPGNHGTHVAGTIAAVNNNATGVGSVAGGNGSTTGVRIMGCHILRHSGEPMPTDEEIAKAFVYAADHGAVIAQNSWEAGKNSEIISEAVNYFMQEAGNYSGSPMKGGLVVWAAGNNSSSEPGKPETDPSISKENLIIVSSVGPDGSKASYSNYGDWIDIAAPGGEYNRQGVLSTIAKNRYGYNQGTSMACPHVSGIAALIVSKYQDSNLTPQEVKRRLLTAVNEVDRYNEGLDCWHAMGSGIADAWKALLENEKKAPQPVKNIWINRSTANMLELCWVMPADKDDQAVDSCIVYEGEKQIALYTGDLSAGDTARYHLVDPQADRTYRFAVQGQDRWGNRSELSKEIAATSGQQAPTIYGEYRYNRFYTYQGNNLASGQQDSLYLAYTFLAPENMTIDYRLDDPGKGLQVEMYEERTLKLLLVTPNQATGTYKASLIAFDKADETRADTLQLTYQVRGVLEYPIPHPNVRPGVSLDLYTTQLEGSLELKLSDYVEDPYEGELLFENRNEDTAMDEWTNGLQTTLKGDTLNVHYQFSQEFMEMIGSTENSIDIVFSATSIYGQSYIFYFHLYYSASTGTEEIIRPTLRVYLNPVTDRLHIESEEPVTRVCVYTITGHMLLNRINPDQTLDVSGFTPGCYLVQLITPSGVRVEKVLKR